MTQAFFIARVGNGGVLDGDHMTPTDIDVDRQNPCDKPRLNRQINTCKHSMVYFCASPARPTTTTGSNVIGVSIFFSNAADNRFVCEIFSFS